MGVFESLDRVFWDGGCGGGKLTCSRQTNA